LFPGVAVKQGRLTAGFKTGLPQQGLDLVFLGAVKYGGGHENAVFIVVCHFHDIGIIGSVDLLGSRWSW
jgi:hypothetical protein